MRLTRRRAVALALLIGAALGPGHAGAMPRPALNARVDTQLIYHGGPVVHSPTTYLLFWLPPGIHYEPAPANDNAYMTLIQHFFADVGGTAYFNIVSQYSFDAAGNTVLNGPILNKSSVGGVYLDTNPYPRSGTIADPLLDTDIRAELERAVAQNHWPRGMNSIFFIFTGAGVPICFASDRTLCSYIPPGGTQNTPHWCAVHKSYPVNVPGTGDTLLYAIMPDILTLHGCDTLSAADPTPNGDQFADGEITLASHELFETVTDPVGYSGWTDTLGGQGEIADKCTSHFLVRAQDGGNVYLHFHRYMVQDEWSNLDTGCAFSSNYSPPFPIPTDPPTDTPSPTVTPIATDTPTPTSTPTTTATPTVTPTTTDTPTPTATATPIWTPTPTATPKPNCTTVAKRAHGKKLRVRVCRNGRLR